MERVPQRVVQDKKNILGRNARFVLFYTTYVIVFLILE
jgi:hypothetical protein